MHTVLVLVENVVDLSLDLVHSSGHVDCQCECWVGLGWFNFEFLLGEVFELL